MRVEHVLAPIYGSPLLQVLFGGSVMLAIGFLVRLRYRSLLRRQEMDRAGLVIYQRSGFALAVLLGFVAAFLPTYLVMTSVVTLVLLALSGLFAGGLLGRIYGGSSVSRLPPS